LFAIEKSLTTNRTISHDYPSYSAIVRIDFAIIRSSPLFRVGHSPPLILW
jgi:hypothetical protein